MSYHGSIISLKWIKIRKAQECSIIKDILYIFHILLIHNHSLAIKSQAFQTFSSTVDGIWIS